ncbi:hypothetical protein D3C73_1022770 [compost metagenome]
MTDRGRYIRRVPGAGLHIAEGSLSFRFNAQRADQQCSKFRTGDIRIRLEFRRRSPCYNLLRAKRFDRIRCPVLSRYIGKGLIQFKSRILAEMRHLRCNLISVQRTAYVFEFIVVTQIVDSEQLFIAGSAELKGKLNWRREHARRNLRTVLLHDRE